MKKSIFSAIVICFASTSERFEGNQNTLAVSYQSATVSMTCDKVN